MRAPWPDCCNTWGPEPPELIEEWKEPIRQQIQDEYEAIPEFIKDLQELYDHADCDEPGKFADDLEALLDDMRYNVVNLKNLQTDLNNVRL